MPKHAMGSIIDDDGDDDDDNDNNNNNNNNNNVLLLLISNYWVRRSMTWRIMEIKEDVIRWG